MAERGRGKLNIEDAKIFWRNFAGRASKYNAEGNRNFCVELDPSVAEELKADGWNIKYTKPRNEDDEPKPYVQVSVSYKLYPPQIYMVTSRNKTLLNEDVISELDRTEIDNVDLIIRPYFWNVGDKSGVKAYVDVMYVTIHEDDFAHKYANVGEEEELPFN